MLRGGARLNNMLELPHLTLYLRRLRGARPGLPWRQQVQTARVQLLLQVLGWSAAALAAGLAATPASEALYLDRRSLFYAVLVLAGFFPYLAAAQQMQQLCSPLASGSPEQPEWFGAPLSSARVLLGVLGSAGLQLLPGLLGVGLIAFSAGTATGTALTTEANLFLGQLAWQALTMLPHYLLLAACLALALRHTRAQAIWQPLLAAAAALHLPGALNFALQGNRGISQWYWYPFTPAKTALSLVALPAALLILALLGWLLLRAAREAPAKPGALFYLLGLLAAGLGLYQYELFAQDSWYIPETGVVDIWSPATRYFELLGRALCPSAPGTFLAAQQSRAGFGAWYWLVPGSVYFYFWWSLAALVFWWRLALRCLDAARNCPRS
jgi:hypothetical protein